MHHHESEPSPQREQVVTTELCHSAQDHTPFEGIAVKGWPTDTILRGEAVLRNGEVVDVNRGEYIHRSAQLVGA